jgi:hypothetical protein
MGRGLDVSDEYPGKEISARTGGRISHEEQLEVKILRTQFMSGYCWKLQLQNDAVEVPSEHVRVDDKHPCSTLFKMPFIPN